MPVEVRRLGLTGLLVDCGDERTRRRVVAGLTARPVAGVIEVVPAAVTVGLGLDPGADPATVARAVLGLPLSEGEVGSEVGVESEVDVEEPLQVPVLYDGADLGEVASLVGLTPAALIDWHTGQTWTCDFTGFLPGFGYLVGESSLVVPRRATPRTRIPAGSVALAGEWCGVYPGASPGGWQLIGRTPWAFFDPSRAQAALLRAGTRVRFRAVTEGEWPR